MFAERCLADLAALIQKTVKQTVCALTSVHVGASRLTDEAPHSRRGVPFKSDDVVQSPGTR